MIPMRDGVKFYTVLILPRRRAASPRSCSTAPLIRRKGDLRSGFGPLPENILSPLSAELVRAGYIVAYQDVRGKYGSEGDMS